MANSYLSSPAIRRIATVSAAALIVLGAGIFFQIKCGSNNNTICQQWSTSDGRQKAYMTSSGSLTLSGTLIGRTSISGAILYGYGGGFAVNGASLKMRGNISGSTLVIDNIAPVANGTVLCKKANGAIGYCSDSITDVECTCN